MYQKDKLAVIVGKRLVSLPRNSIAGGEQVIETYFMSAAI